MATAGITVPTTAAVGSLAAADPAPVRNPELSANFFSGLFMTYLHPLLWLGAKRPLQQADLGSVMPSDAAAELTARFTQEWRAELTAAAALKREPSMAKALRRTLGWSWAFAIAAFFAAAGLNFLPPLILQQLVSSLQGTNPLSTRDAWIDVVALLVVPLASSLLTNWHNNVMARVGTNMRTCLTGAIYAKALVLRPSAEFTTGEVRSKPAARGAVRTITTAPDRVPELTTCALCVQPR